MTPRPRAAYPEHLLSIDNQGGNTVLAGEQLQHIDNYVDAVNLLRGEGALTDQQASELTGFGLLPGKDKELLLGVPFLIIQYEFKVGRDSSSFVECAIITTHDDKHLLRDSSKGIYVQLRNVYEERVATGNPNPDLGYPVRKGLTYQDHNYTGLTGETTKSRTYYLAP